MPAYLPGKGASSVTEDSSRAMWLPQARTYLRHADPVLARLIEGRPDFDPRAWMAQLPAMDLYGALLFQVTGQQLSVPATRRTLARIQAMFGGHLPAPAELLAVDPSQLRQAGLSWRKINTLRDLATRLTDGRLDAGVLSTMPDDELMTELTAIPGIGPWTVQGAMLIALQREDVVLPGRLSAGPPAHPGGGPGYRREMAALPQPGDQLPVLRRLRASRGTTGRPADERLRDRAGIVWHCLRAGRTLAPCGPSTGRRSAWTGSRSSRTRTLKRGTQSKSAACVR